jgi:hypothetical protein
MKYLSKLFLLLALITLGCQTREMTKISEKNTKEAIAKEDPLAIELPPNTQVEEIEVKGQKILKIKLPDGFHFLIDGQRTIETELTCSCSAGAGVSCFPYVLISGGKKTAKCYANSCSSCIKSVSGKSINKENFSIQIGKIDNVNLIDGLAQQDEEVRKIFNKGTSNTSKVKAVTSYTEYVKMNPARTNDMEDVEVKKAIKDIAEQFYTDYSNNTKIPYPNLKGKNTLPEGYAFLPLSVNGGVFHMIVPDKKEMNHYNFRTLPWSIFYTMGCKSPAGCTCNFAYIPSQGSDDIIVICSYCNGCTLQY